jgi:hypothetical protein
MTYRVTFIERTNGAGQLSEFPPDYVAIDLPDGMVRAAARTTLSRR